ncbi:MAG: YceD family protein [Alphaproteobacteria bacterium]
MTDTLNEFEWSHFIDSSPIGERETKIEIDAPADVLENLCKRLKVHSIDSLKACVYLQRNAVNRYVHVKGDIKAELKQCCVITTDPVSEIVHDAFSTWYVEPNKAVSFTKAKRDRLSPKEKDELPMLEEEEDPEMIVDGKIDLGELIVQNLSLALNPYPRVEGAAFEQDKEGECAPEGMYDNPFAALKEWKTKENEGE